MTRDEIRQVVLSALAEIAPEIHSDEIEPGVPLRDQVDLDSVDFVNFVIAIDEKLGVDIPETDYSKVATLDACVDYLGAHGAQPRPPIKSSPGEEAAR